MWKLTSQFKVCIKMQRAKNRQDILKTTKLGEPNLLTVKFAILTIFNCTVQVLSIFILLGSLSPKLFCLAKLGPSSLKKHVPIPSSAQHPATTLLSSVSMSLTTALGTSDKWNYTVFVTDLFHFA